MTQEHHANREQLEQDANLLRERIARNLESLDQRRHEAFDVKEQVKKHPLPGLILGISTLLAVTSSAAAIAYRVRHRRFRRVLQGVEALSRAWHHPDRVAKSGEPLSHEIARGVAVSVASFVAAQLVKQALAKFVPELVADSEKASAPAR